MPLRVIAALALTALVLSACGGSNKPKPLVGGPLTLDGAVSGRIDATPTISQYVYLATTKPVELQSGTVTDVTPGLGVKGPLLMPIGTVGGSDVGAHLKRGGKPLAGQKLRANPPLGRTPAVGIELHAKVPGRYVIGGITIRYTAEKKTYERTGARMIQCLGGRGMRCPKRVAGIRGGGVVQDEGYRSVTAPRVGAEPVGALSGPNSKRLGYTEVGGRRGQSVSVTWTLSNRDATPHRIGAKASIGGLPSPRFFVQRDLSSYAAPTAMVPWHAFTLPAHSLRTFQLRFKLERDGCKGSSFSAVLGEITLQIDGHDQRLQMADPLHTIEGKCS